LPDSKKRYIGYFIEQKVIENDNITAMILDDCFKAAIIEVKDLSLSDCNEIIKIANEHMTEIKSILEKDLKGEYLIMIKDEKIRSQIKEEAKAIIKDNKKINNLEIIRNLEENYDFAKKDLQIVIKEAREELAAEALKEFEKAIEGNDKDKVVNINDEKEFPKAKLIKKEITPIQMPSQEIPKEGLKITLDTPGIKTTKGLEIESITIKGVHGRYFKVSEGVKIGDKLYKDISEVREQKDYSEELARQAKENATKQIEKLNKELENIDKEWKAKSEKYAEIEAVFAM
jgi:hypothetical protein